MERSALLAFLLVAACGGSAEPARSDAGVPPDAAASAEGGPAEFSVLTLKRDYFGGGSCLPVGAAVDVTFTRQSNGTLHMKGTYADAWVSFATDACPEGTTHWTNNECLCLAEVAIGLTTAQQDELEQLVAALPDSECEPTPGLSCDPCLVTTLELDDRRESSPCCGTRNSPSFGPAFDSIEDFIDGMMPGAGR